jgi:ribosomal-protein-alanine N-acetyltransferase
VVVIIEASQEDLDLVLLIESDSYPSPWTLNFFRLMLNAEPGLFIVAKEYDVVIGYTVGEVESRGRLGVAGHVMNIAVDRNHRKSGVGTGLLDELERRFLNKGANVSYLEVRESNVIAQRMYRDRGYVYLNKVENYYGDEDGLVMVKRLNGEISMAKR